MLTESFPANAYSSNTVTTCGKYFARQIIAKRQFLQLPDIDSQEIRRLKQPRIIPIQLTGYHIQSRDSVQNTEDKV